MSNESRYERIAAAIGTEAAKQLCALFGGEWYSVSKYKRTELTAFIGAEHTRTILALYAGKSVKLPKLDVVLERERRELLAALVPALLARGESVRSAAKRLGVSPAFIFRNRGTRE